MSFEIVFMSRPTVKCGILECHHIVLDALLFGKKDFIATVMYSKRQSIWQYIWMDNNILMLMKSNLGVACSVSLVH